MTFLSHRSSGLIFALVMSMTIGCAFFAPAQQQAPIDFDDYHGYTNSVKYLKAVTKAYPEITELMVIGQTTMGRDINVLVITNKSIGTTIDRHVQLRNMRKEGVQNVPPMTKHMGKPAQWIDGAMHGNEFTATEVCLYIIDKLVTGYGNDEAITELIDKKVIYVCPNTNPDGNFNSVERDMPQRQNSMMIDNDKDGKVNEDGADDLNGDGHITNFRYQDDEGGYVMDDVDPRHMVRAGRDQESGKQRYSVVKEDIDNDGDGRRGEDGEAGIDVNRNFPEGWEKEDGTAGGTGYYPTSSPEARAIAEFFTNYRNILMMQNFHTSGGFTYRPPGTAMDDAMDPKDVSVYDRVMGKKYLELIGNEVPEAWKADGPLDTFKEELKKAGANEWAQARGYIMPTGWINSSNEESGSHYGYGMIIDWVYQQYGAFSTTTELWNSRKDMKGIPEFVGEDAALMRERAMLKYQDEEFGGKFFINWTPYTHPELGEGEIGGWIPKYRGNNAFPGDTLRGVCEIHWQFELFRALLLPEVVITDATAKILYYSDDAHTATVTQDGDQVSIKKGDAKGKYKIVEVTANVENVGKLATHVARGARLSGNRQDVVWLIGDRDKITFLQGSAFQQIGVLEGAVDIPGFETQREGGRGERGNVQRAGRGGGNRQRAQRQRPGGQRGQRGGQQGQDDEAQAGSKREVKWLIAIEGDSPLKVVITSQKGGTQVKEIEIN